MDLAFISRLEYVLYPTFAVECSVAMTPRMDGWVTDEFEDE
jgi:hypothetical protein